MPLNSDLQYKTSLPANTTPVAPDGAGTSEITLGGYSLTNTATAARYLKWFDKASAPVVGTDVPLRTVAVPASGGHVAISFHRGILFKLGMWVTVTVNGADTDNTAPAANDVLLTVDYQK
jgi:hypothetical protein